MTSSIILEIFIILVLILVNGFFAMAEIAIVSVRKPRLKQQADKGDKKAQLALKLAEDPEDLLSTVQIGITLIAILTGVFGGATLAADLATLLSTFGIPMSYSEPIGLVVVVACITYFSLVIGELVPKSVGLQNAERVATAVSTFMHRLSRLVYPVVWLLTISTQLITRLLGVKQSEEAPVTDEEIAIMLDQGAQAGAFDPEEPEMVKRIFRLSDRTVNLLMTPRREIVWLDIADPANRVLEKVATTGYSRFPVAQNSLDHVVGFVEVKDILKQKSLNTGIDLSTIMTSPMYVPKSMPALELLEKFKQDHQHMSLIFDEYGGLQGLVTSNDLLEAIVGDIDPPRIPPIVRRNDQSWLIDGMYTLVDLLDYLNLNDAPLIRGRYQTIGGFMMAALGKVPTEGEYYDWHGFRFEVVDMDDLRVDKVLVSSLANEYV